MVLKNDSKYSPMYEYLDEKNVYKCLECEKNNKIYTTVRQTTISEHCARKHAGRKYKCTYCDKIFESEASRKQHIINNHREAECKCPCKDCKKKPMKNMSQVQIHYGTIHCTDSWEKIDNYWKCKICNITFKSSTACAYHVAACIPDSPFGKKYKTTNNDITKHYCPFKNCNKKEAMNKAGLRRHIGSVHLKKYCIANKDKWECKICKKNFKSKEGCCYHVVSCVEKDNTFKIKEKEDIFNSIEKLKINDENSILNEFIFGSDEEQANKTIIDYNEEISDESENDSDENDSDENDSDENDSDENDSDENDSDENDSDENDSDENDSDENEIVMKMIVMKMIVMKMIVMKMIVMKMIVMKMIVMKINIKKT